MISVAIIPDGSRRYAQKERVSLPMAYDRACDKVEDVLDWALESKLVDEVTVWGLSTENFKRDASQLSLLNGIYKKSFERLIGNEKIYKNRVRVRVIGKREALDRSLVSLIEKAEDATRLNNAFVLNIALAYGGREEILNAVEKALSHGEGLTEESVQRNLYVSRSPDLIIRTSGIQRLSGYLAWQSAYSELYFTKQLWPEFTKDEFMKALDFYKSTKRNFGR
ncbi:di-trans,poly-cis-decaprenylcistransferase [Candidatus Micrarchaeota archaeon]|nr:di-trans,poly-cis-decaprenylcistransferase [Candidatus Micrarchaeota archaeon]